MAQIDCPSCQAAFEVEDSRLNQSLDRSGQRHMRCGECKLVFAITPKNPTELARIEDEISLSIKPSAHSEPEQSLEVQPDLPPDLPNEFPDFLASRSPLTAPENHDFRAQNRPQTDDFRASKPPKMASNPKNRPTKPVKQRSGLTAFLAFLILVTLIVLAGVWISMTHPEWFRASYWLETYI